MTDAHTPSLLEFPCAFPIKTVGIADDDFDTFVATVVAKHVDVVSAGAISKRASSGGKYVSVTITVQASNQEQLDGIYRELSAHERVIMVL